MLLPIRGQLKPRTDGIIGLAGIATLAAIWCFLTYGGYIRPFFLPKPHRMLDGLLEFHSRNWLLPAIWRSFWRVTKALGFVVALGVPIGVLMGTFTPVDAFSRKIINGAKSIPTTGVIGLIVVWFGIEERGKIVFLFIGAIFYMVILVKSAVLAVPPDYIRVALDLGANRRQMIWRVLLPGALPQIWDAFAVCNGIMWTYIVLAEFINSSEEQLGLGYLLQIGSRTQDVAKVFAMLIVIAAISAGTDWFLQSIRRRFLDW
jgi:NitT/TauT family transport system permease protein